LSCSNKRITFFWSASGRVDPTISKQHTKPVRDCNGIVERAATCCLGFSVFQGKPRLAQCTKKGVSKRANPTNACARKSCYSCFRSRSDSSNSRYGVCCRVCGLACEGFTLLARTSVVFGPHLAATAAGSSGSSAASRGSSGPLGCDGLDDWALDLLLLIRRVKVRLRLGIAR